jgi:hypothetical protein
MHGMKNIRIWKEENQSNYSIFIHFSVEIKQKYHSSCIIRRIFLLTVKYESDWIQRSIAKTKIESDLWEQFFQQNVEIMIFIVCWSMILMNNTSHTQRFLFYW